MEFDRFYLREIAPPWFTANRQVPPTVETFRYCPLSATSQSPTYTPHGLWERDFAPGRSGLGLALSFGLRSPPGLPDTRRLPITNPANFLVIWFLIDGWRP